MTRDRRWTLFAPSVVLAMLLVALTAFFATPQEAGVSFAFERGATPDPADSARALYRRTAPCVVGITVRSLPRSRPRSQITHFGTGSLVDPVGLVLTSTTVVPAGSRHVEVYVAGGRVGSARIVKVIPEKEISFLRVEKLTQILPKSQATLPFFRLGNSCKIRVGDPAYSFGNAFHSIEADDQIVMAAGIVSGRLDLKEKHPESTYVGDVLETTAALNSGMDGGPLVDGKGELVGLLILNFAKDRWLGTAIPANVFKPYLREQRAWFDGGSDEYAAIIGFEAAALGKDATVHVLAVSEKGPAAAAGIRKGDVLQSLDGKALESLSQLHGFVQAAKPGQKVRVGVRRAGKNEAIEIELWGSY